MYTTVEDFLTYRIIILPIFSAPPTLPPPRPVIKDSPPSSKEFTWVDCCFGCDSRYEWYDLRGKGKDLREVVKNSFHL